MYCSKGVALTFVLVVFKVSNDDLTDARVVGLNVNNMRLPYGYPVRRIPQNRYIIRRPVRHVPIFRTVKPMIPPKIFQKTPSQNREPSLDEMIASLDNIEKQLNSSSFNELPSSTTDITKQKQVTSRAVQGQSKTNSVLSKNVDLTPNSRTIVIKKTNDGFHSTPKEDKTLSLPKKDTTTPRTKNKTFIDKNILLLIAKTFVNNMRASSAKVRHNSDTSGYETPSTERKVSFNNAESAKGFEAVPFSGQRKIVEVNGDTNRPHAMKDMTSFATSTEFSPTIPENTIIYSRQNMETYNTAAFANGNFDQFSRGSVYRQHHKESGSVENPTYIKEPQAQNQRTNRQSNSINPQSQDFSTRVDNVQTKPSKYKPRVSHLNIDIERQNQEFQKRGRTVLSNSPTTDSAAENNPITRKGNLDSVRSIGLRHSANSPFLFNGKSFRQPLGVRDQINKGGSSVNLQFVEATPTAVQPVENRNNHIMQKITPQRQLSTNTLQAAGPQYLPERDGELASRSVSNQYQHRQGDLYDVPNNVVTPQPSNNIIKEGGVSMYRQQSPNRHMPPEQMGPSVPHQVSLNAGETSASGQFQQYIPRQLAKANDVTDNLKANVVGTQGQFKHYIPRELLEPSGVTHKNEPYTEVTSGQYQEYSLKEPLNPSDVSKTNHLHYKLREQHGRSYLKNNANNGVTSGEYHQYTPRDQLRTVYVKNNPLPPNSVGQSAPYQQYRLQEQRGPKNNVPSEPTEMSGRYQQYIPKEHLRLPNVASNEVLKTDVTSVKTQQYGPQEQIRPSVQHQAEANTGIGSVSGQFQQYIPRQLSNHRELLDPSGAANKLEPNTGVNYKYTPNVQPGPSDASKVNYQQYIPAQQLGASPSEVSKVSNQNYIPQQQIGPGPSEVSKVSNQHYIPQQQVGPSPSEVPKVSNQHYIPQQQIGPGPSEVPKVSNQQYIPQQQIGPGPSEVPKVSNQQYLPQQQLGPGGGTNNAIYNDASTTRTEPGVIKGTFQLNNQVMSCVCQPPANDRSNIYTEKQNRG